MASVLATKDAWVGAPEGVDDDDAWAGIELVDVVDEADTITHQLYLWPCGSGELFANDTTKSVARIIQHVFRMEKDDELFRCALGLFWCCMPAQAIDPCPHPRWRASAERSRRRRADAEVAGRDLSRRGQATPKQPIAVPMSTGKAMSALSRSRTDLERDLERADIRGG